MLTKKQVSEIKEHLSKAQSPVFFFDNDVDGLSSFLLLQRYIERGKGFPIKSFPAMNEEYLKKAQELNADYIFILDKPVVSEEFFDAVHKVNLPVVWIDHHEIDRSTIPDFVNYFNPLFNRKKTSEPITTLCYQVTKKKDDLWIAVVGSIYDRFFPNFYKKFKKSYPDLAIDSKDAYSIYYNSEIGKVARMLNDGLKDRTTNVIQMLKFMMKAKTPYDVLTETNQNHMMHLRFKQIDSKYQTLLAKAKKTGLQKGKVLFFKFAGELSISSDLANELCFMFPKKIVIVAYDKGIVANISVRGKSVREKVLKAIDGLENATGGGHEDAVGAKVQIKDLDIFRKRMEELVD